MSGCLVYMSRPIGFFISPFRVDNVLLSVFTCSSIFNFHTLPRPQTPVFACKVKKIKENGDAQKRHFLVTTHAVYNFKPADTFRVYPAARRVIPLRELCAIIVSSSSEQMVLGCKTECVRIFLHALASPPFLV